MAKKKLRLLYLLTVRQSARENVQNRDIVRGNVRSEESVKQCTQMTVAMWDSLAVAESHTTCKKYTLLSQLIALC
jgi:hypothetical protein